MASLLVVLFLLVLGGWIAVVRSQRFRRRKENIDLIGPSLTAPLMQLDEEDLLLKVNQVLTSISQYEFPFTFNKSLEFGLFRTYGIPSISKILVGTGRLYSPDDLSVVGKRYDDTDFIIREMLFAPISSAASSKRSLTAIQRLNLIHDHYKILNSDMLYTLAVFIIEPIDWIAKFEWRGLAKEEKKAYFLNWKHIGKLMGIEGIPDTLEELYTFYNDYEVENMKYSQNNKKLGENAISLFLYHIPSFLHPFARQVIFVFVPPRLSKAMDFPLPNKILQTFVFGLMKLRSLFTQYFLLPRFDPLSRIPNKTAKDGIYIPVYHPYFETYKDGYRIEELGPSELKGLMKGVCPVYRKGKEVRVELEE